MEDWQRLPAIPRWSEERWNTRYLYLARFEAVAKVGVTTNPAGRVRALARELGPAREVVAIKLGEHDARLREAAVAHRFGGPNGRPGRGSEYFPTERYEAAKEIVSQPVAEFRSKDLARIRAAQVSAERQRRCAAYLAEHRSNPTQEAA